MKRTKQDGGKKSWKKKKEFFCLSESAGLAKIHPRQG